MRRCALALLGLLALPAAVAAQDRPLLSNEPPPEQLPESRFAISPFIGVRVPFNTGTFLALGESGSQFVLEQERGGGTMVGVNAEARVRGPLSLVAGLAYTGREQDVLIVQNAAGDLTQFESDGPAMWFAKAGVSVRLPDPIPDNRRFHPSAFITVAPGVVWMDWDDVDGASDEFNGTTTHFALNLGADAIARFGTRGNWAFTLGVEDYITFWDTDELRARDEVVGGVVADEPVVIDYDYSSSNILLLRVGVSYRMR